LAAAGTEQAEQTALFCQCQLNWRTYPELRWYHAIPNGGQRERIVATMLKAGGVRSGVFDTFLPVAREQYHGLYLEMKRKNLYRPDKPCNGCSENQIAFQQFAVSQGYAAIVCYGWEHAWRALKGYLDLPNLIRTTHTLGTHR
jgi:hypothetical protein